MHTLCQINLEGAVGSKGDEAKNAPGCLGFGVWGLGFGVWGLGLGVGS